ncbi:hypothetical protein bmyco0003_8870 [Bacillus pseudomycoides]|nr:hypothetical protein bmyco0002_9330 [Bacillus pseudomycoides]EEM12391.1 hypothetical protein bmyco0003_8870 [Bacillus pseudomycoides]
MKTKIDILSFVFTWHRAKKGSDRFYPWTDALFLNLYAKK